MGSKGNLNEVYTTQETYKYTDTNGNPATATYDITHEAATINFRQFHGSESQIKELIGNGFYSTCCTCTNHYSIKFTKGTSSSMEVSGNHYIYNIGIEGAKDASELIQRILQGTNNGNPRNHFTKMVEDNGKLIIYDDRCNAPRPMLPVGMHYCASSLPLIYSEFYFQGVLQKRATHQTGQGNHHRLRAARHSLASRKTASQCSAKRSSKHPGQ